MTPSCTSKRRYLRRRISKESTIQSFYLLSFDLSRLTRARPSVVDQTERRVFDEEKLSFAKLVSIFEPHTDILCKRDSVVVRT